MAGDVVSDPLDLGHGVLKLPDVPGLGASIDPGALARHRRQK
jgi:L-alanine-DL-glutamate epimerase-like enolase superfamily enzyme